MVFLRCRPANQADLDECLPKTRDYACHTEETRRPLRQMWQEMVGDRVSNFAVIEDTDAPQGQQILWFSFKIFVAEAFVERVAEMPLPLSRSLLALWCQGRRIVLTPTEFHRASGEGGVHCVVLNSGMSRDAWAGEKQAWVASKSIEWCWYSTCGYHLRSLHLEAYGPFEWDWAKGFGLRPKNDYDFFCANAAQIPPNDFPRLFGAEVQPMANHAGTPLSIIFRHQPAQFYFPACEQELLLWAFSGCTDAELAAELHLAPITLKKRWQRIYERVEAIAPEIMGGPQVPNGKRGPEKKRRLLNYLRHHMEELRPSCKPK